MSMSLTLILLIYVVLNLISFVSFVWDKHKAKEGAWRTKESTLLLTALFGPFGAVAGIKLAGHKTQKIKFKLVYVFLVLHIILIIYLFVL